MKVLILGYDETGQQLHEIIPDADIIDIDKGIMPPQLDTTPRYDVILICIPFSDKSKIIMKNVKAIYRAKAYIVYTKEIPYDDIASLHYHRGYLDKKGFNKVIGLRNSTVDAFCEEYFGDEKTSAFAKEVPNG